MKSDKDLSTKDYTLEDIEKFSYKDKYEKLLQSHPLLMNTLVGSMTNEGADTLEVISNNLSSQYKYYLNILPSTRILSVKALVAEGKLIAT